MFSKFYSVSMILSTLIFAQTSSADINKFKGHKTPQVVKTAPCKKTSKAGEIVVDDFFAWRMINQGVRKVVVNPNAHCYRYKQTANFKIKGKKESLFSAKVQSIQVHSSLEAIHEFVDIQAQVAEFLMANPAKESFIPFAVITFEIEEYLDAKPENFSKAYLGNSKFAQHVQRRRAESIIVQGGFVAYTTDRQEMFDATDFKNSGPMFWSKKHQGFAFNDSKAIRFKGVYHTDLGKLPKKKSYPIILMGRDQYDHRPFILAYELAQRAYSNIYLFAGGLRNWKNPSGFMPSKYSGVKILDANKTLQKVLNAANIIDIRDMIERRDSISLPNAKPLPYTEAVESPRNPAMVAEQLITDQFDTSKLPLNKTEQLVFYGTDSNDWRPLKAAIKALNSGYKRVYVFQGGVSHWTYYNLKYPRRFKVTKN